MLCACILYTLEHINAHRKVPLRPLPLLWSYKQYMQIHTRYNVQIKVCMHVARGQVLIPHTTTTSSRTAMPKECRTRWEMGLPDGLQKPKKGSCVNWNTMVRPPGKLVMCHPAMSLHSSLLTRDIACCHPRLFLKFCKSFLLCVTTSSWVGWMEVSILTSQYTSHLCYTELKDFK